MKFLRNYFTDRSQIFRCFLATVASFFCGKTYLLYNFYIGKPPVLELDITIGNNFQIFRLIVNIANNFEKKCVSRQGSYFRYILQFTVPRGMFSSKVRLDKFRKTYCRLHRIVLKKYIEDT